MLSNLMAFRNVARKAFQKYQFIIETVFKFIISFAAYDRIVHELNYNATLSKFILKLGFGLVGAVLPPIITILLCVCVALFEVFSGSPIMAVLCFAVFVVLFCFAARFSGKFAYAIVAIPLLVPLNLHYIVPLLLGMTATPLAIFPAAVGVITYYIFGAVNNSITGDKITSFDDMLALYVRFINDIFANKEMFYVAGIFAFIIVVMWALRKIRFDYSFEITIAIGGLLMVIGHLIAGLYVPMSISVGHVILGSIFSVILVYIVQFFRIVLNYSGCETVRFEDDDYYYYVQAVPKLDKVVLGEVVVSEEAKEAAKERTPKAFFKRLAEAPKKSLFARMMEQSELEKKEFEEKAKAHDAEENAAEDAEAENGSPEEDEEDPDLDPTKMSVYKAVFSGLAKKRRQTGTNTGNDNNNDNE